MFELSTAGYESFHKNREYKGGDGVICCVKNTLPALETDKQDVENCDSVYVEISTKSNKIMIATIYRPPKAQAADDTALYEEIQSVIQNKQAVIIGDFNCPRIRTHDNKTKIPDYRKTNFNRARQLLPPAAWNRLNLSDADTAWADFKNKLLEVERATVPMKTRRLNGTLNLP